MKYIALLRGINVGGNNKVAMSELKHCFEDIGFTNVTTYINSGNVIFETDSTDKVQLVQACEQVIEDHFGFHIICAVISAAELRDALAHAPDWWDKDKDAKHNAIFVIAPQTTQNIIQAVGEAKIEYESVESYEPIIFWSATLKTFGRTRYSKIVSTKAYQSVTIRNANTTKKLLELSS
jgi:uncharacterized protein (DUF1697 family)